MTLSTGIFFEKRNASLPKSGDLLRVHNLFEKAVLNLGVEPNWFSASDGKTRTQYRKFNGRFHKKVLVNKFIGYESVSIAVTSPESDAPGWESFIVFNFDFSPVGKTTELSIVIQHPYLSYISLECERLILDFAKIWSWDFGYAIEHYTERSPLMYISGGLTNTMTPEDRLHVEKWYFSSHKPESRLTKIRDVFAYNVISAGHLNYELSPGFTVKNFIEGDKNSTLITLANKLWLWKVEAGMEMVVREKLLGTGFIVTE